MSTLVRRSLLSVGLDRTSYRDATSQVMGWARACDSRYVCVANVHVTMEAYDSAAYRACINGADLVVPDGMPLVWGLRLIGVRNVTHVRGPELMRWLLRRAAADAIPIGFLGGTPDVLHRLVDTARSYVPELTVAYAYSPPFRELTADEDAAIVDAVNASGARILFVSLGCPRQERWIATHRGRIAAVMLGVGAAFDFLVGAKPEAPVWMQNTGLEWAFRLATEPRRLWRRYAYHNPRFVALLAMQWIRSLGARPT